VLWQRVAHQPQLTAEHLPHGFPARHRLRHVEVVYKNNVFDRGSGDMPCNPQFFYGELENERYTLLAGYNSSAFTDIDVFPNTLDYEGTNSFTFKYGQQIRFSAVLCRMGKGKLTMLLSMEKPNADVTRIGDYSPYSPLATSTLACAGKCPTGMCHSPTCSGPGHARTRHPAAPSAPVHSPRSLREPRRCSSATVRQAGSAAATATPTSCRISLGWRQPLLTRADCARSAPVAGAWATRMTGATRSVPVPRTATCASVRRPICRSIATSQEHQVRVVEPSLAVQSAGHPRHRTPVGLEHHARRHAWRGPPGKKRLRYNLNSCFSRPMCCAATSPATLWTRPLFIRPEKHPSMLMVCVVTLRKNAQIHAFAGRDLCHSLIASDCP